jgi:hypothetical protein
MSMSMTPRAGAGVEIAGGFVGVDDAGVVDERAGDGHALLLAAGKFGGQVMETLG